MNAKQLQKAAEAGAQQALTHGNPYKTRATVFYIGREPRYIYGEEVYTAEQIDREYIKTAIHDFICGYNERKTGYYDKWYRYSHADEGRAYDIGVRAAAGEAETPADFHIIECIH